MELTKRIIVLGAGRGQVGLCKAAHKLGYRTIVVSPEGDYPGFSYADEKAFLDITDEEAVVELARKTGADGIVTAGMDAGLYSIGRVCDECGLKGFSAESALMSTNKYNMKMAFAEAGVNTAGFEKVSSLSELDAAVKRIGLPVIIKAVDLGGSRGISIVKTEDDLIPGFDRTMGATHQDYCIVEEYLDGYECSASAFMIDGDVSFVLPMGDVRYGDDEEIPIGHYAPFEGEENILDEIRSQVSLAAHAIGLRDCAVNADLMIYEGKVYILELTGRLGANCIPEITSLACRRDIYEMILEASAGNLKDVEKTGTTYEKESCIVGRMIISERDGTFRSVRSGCNDLTEYDDSMSDTGSVRQIWLFKKPGDAVDRFRSPGDCLGQIVVRGDSLEQCRSVIDETLNRLDIVIA